MTNEKALEKAIALYKEKEDKYRRLRQEAEGKLRQLVHQKAVDDLKVEATP